MQKYITNVLSFMFMLLGCVIFGYEPVIVTILFMIYMRMD